MTTKIKSYKLKTMDGEFVGFRWGKFFFVDYEVNALSYHDGWSRGNMEAIRKDAETQLVDDCVWIEIGTI